MPWTSPIISMQSHSWRIIPILGYVVNLPMVIVNSSPFRIGQRVVPLPFMAFLWLINGGDPFTTYPSVLGSHPPSSWCHGNFGTPHLQPLGNGGHTDGHGFYVFLVFPNGCCFLLSIFFWFGKDHQILEVWVYTSKLYHISCLTLYDR